jgi:hypothetical protein
MSRRTARALVQNWWPVALWVGVAVAGSLIAAIGAFENIAFVYQGV